jgi:hypothetical protein
MRKQLTRSFASCVVALSLSSRLAQAGVVYLSCSGTIDSLALNKIGAESGPISIAVDVEKGTVAVLGHEPWPIAKDDHQNFVSFAGSFVDETGMTAGTKGAQLFMGGWINRVSGETVLHVNTNGPNGPQDGLWVLQCKAAHPLF